MSWQTFGIEVKERLLKSWDNEVFVGYFILCILLIGALGVILSIFEYFDKSDELYKIAFSMGTYSIAITASAFVDLNLSTKIKQKRSFLVYSIIVFSICISLLIATYFTKTNSAFIYSSFGCVFSWVLWVVANSDSENLNSNYDEGIRSESNNLSKNW